jgi:ABC-2 type transport system ATP-binding protein
MTGQNPDSQSPNSQPMARASGLSRKFGDLTAVDRLNLEISRGEIFGLVGPDGAGKTTTLRLLSGLMNPTSGSVEIAGFDLASGADKVKDLMGYMAQRFGLYVDLTVEENMQFYADLFGLPAGERGPLIQRLMKMTRMDPFRSRPAGKLSGGMKQKLALMCALLHHPQILFLDEPTNGVDPVSRRDFWAILYQLVKDGMTVVITTAYLDEAERCNRVGLMHEGRLVRCAPPGELKSSMEETCYEVQVQDQRTARDFFSRNAAVLSVEPAGAFLHLFLAAGAEQPEKLAAGLAAAGGGTAAFRPISPSLEDVFIALIRKTEIEANGKNSGARSARGY